MPTLTHNMLSTSRSRSLYIVLLCNSQTCPLHSYASNHVQIHVHVCELCALYHSVFIQKRKEREAAIMKNSKLTDEQRSKWLKVMTNDFMSSEESGDDDSIVVRPIPWRSKYVNQMFSKIDKYCNHKKSPHALRQMKTRSIGSPSV